MPTDGFLLASNGDHRGKRAHRKPQLYPVTRKKGGASQGKPSETPYGKPGGPRRSGERSALAERTFGILGKIVCRLRMFLQEGWRRDKAVCCGDITSRRDIVQIGNAQQGLNDHVHAAGPAWGPRRRSGRRSCLPRYGTPSADPPRADRISGTPRGSTGSRRQAARVTPRL